MGLHWELAPGIGQRAALIAATAAIAAIVLAAGCAKTPVSLEPASAPGSLGSLDTAYDRAKWRWVKNLDGRALLEHTELEQCFVNPKPDQGFTDPGFSVTRAEKIIGATRYEVVSVYEQRDFWEAIYMRPGTNAPVLGVYARGKCQDEAERILQAYEKSLQK